MAPFLTARADEPLMADFVRLDVEKTVDMIDQTGAAAPLRFRPTENAARQLWAQQFTGEAVGLSKLHEAQGKSPAGLNSRQVRTSQK